MEGRKKILDLGHAPEVLLCQRAYLDPVARGKDHTLLEGLLLQEPPERVSDRLRREGEPLPDFHGGGPVVEPYDEDVAHREIPALPLTATGWSRSGGPAGGD